MEIIGKKYFGFYGSLRKGEYNYMALMHRREGVEYLKTVKVAGFKLYSLGSYPVAIPSSKDDSLTVDIFRITNESVIKRIDGMEVGAGYERTLLVEPATEWEQGDPVEFVTYIGSERYKSYINKKDLIPDGDWGNRNNKPRTNLDEC